MDALDTVKEGDLSLRVIGIEWIGKIALRLKSLYLDQICELDITKSSKFRKNVITWIERSQAERTEVCSKLLTNSYDQDLP